MMRNNPHFSNYSYLLTFDLKVVHIWDYDSLIQNARVCLILVFDNRIKCTFWIHKKGTR